MRELTLTRQADSAMPQTMIGSTRPGNVVASRRKRCVPAHKPEFDTPAAHACRDPANPVLA